MPEIGVRLPRRKHAGLTDNPRRLALVRPALGGSRHCVLDGPSSAAASLLFFSQAEAPSATLQIIPPGYLVV